MPWDRRLTVKVLADLAQVISAAADLRQTQVFYSFHIIPSPPWFGLVFEICDSFNRFEVGVIRIPPIVNLWSIKDRR